MSVKRVLITGITGYISQYLIKTKPQNVLLFGTTHRRELRSMDGVEKQFFLDLTKPIKKQLEKLTFSVDVVLHTAAMSSLALCQREPELALQVNTRATRELAEWCQQQQVRFIYFSTDIVFKGNDPPYDEQSQPDPINQYGFSKWQGEIVVQQSLKNFAIARIALALAAGLNNRRNFIDWFWERLNNNQPIPLFKDEIRTPTYTPELAKNIWKLALSEENGIFHVCGAQSIDRFTLGKALCDVLGRGHELLRPISLRDMTDYPRPLDVSLLSTRRLNGQPFKIKSILEYLPFLFNRV